MSVVRTVLERRARRLDRQLSSGDVVQEVVNEPSSPRKSGVTVESLESERVRIAKEGFSTRRVPKQAMRTLVCGAVRPRAGDLVLARVDCLRQHARLELPTGRRALLDVGSEIIIACGSRYASDQFEGFVPSELGPANLIASGGIAAVETQRARGIRHATDITLLGLIGDQVGATLNLMSFALPTPEVQRKRPPVVAVFGASMNSGKTTTARFLVAGLRAAGHRVGYAKLTGTGSGGDYWALVDAGASRVVDFTDAGLAATYTTPVSALEASSLLLLGHLVEEGCDRIVVEIADGLLQDETAALLRSRVIHGLVDRVLFAAADALAGAAGVVMLRHVGFDVAGVSGLLTASPLPAREAARAGAPVWSKEDLANPAVAAELACYRSGNGHGAPSPLIDARGPLDERRPPAISGNGNGNGRSNGNGHNNVGRSGNGSGRASEQAEVSRSEGL
jgi:hypothetical protein